MRLPRFNRAALMDLRCDEVKPLNVTLLELEPHQCKWPVSGERANTRFCGHLRLEASSYCLDHQALSIGRGTPSERRTA
jgi:GcrA cell cycle regulator